jgi:hypothetical protein
MITNKLIKERIFPKIQKAKRLGIKVFVMFHHRKYFVDYPTDGKLVARPAPMFETFHPLGKIISRYDLDADFFATFTRLNSFKVTTADELEQFFMLDLTLTDFDKINTQE